MLVNHFPQHLIKRFYSVKEALLLKLAHGILRVADLNGDFLEFKLVDINFPDNFAVIFVTVVTGVDYFRGFSGISAKAGLAVGDP